MATSMELFDAKAFGRRKQKRRAPRSAIAPPVRAALERLKTTLDSLPAQELERRRRLYESMERREQSN